MPAAGPGSRGRGRAEGREGEWQPPCPWNGRTEPGGGGGRPSPPPLLSRRCAGTGGRDSRERRAGGSGPGREGPRIPALSASSPGRGGVQGRAWSRREDGFPGRRVPLLGCAWRSAAGACRGAREEGAGEGVTGAPGAGRGAAAGRRRAGLGGGAGGPAGVPRSERCPGGGLSPPWLPPVLRSSIPAGPGAR